MLGEEQTAVPNSLRDAPPEIQQQYGKYLEELRQQPNVSEGDAKSFAEQFANNAWNPGSHEQVLSLVSSFASATGQDVLNDPNAGATIRALLGEYRTGTVNLGELVASNGQTGAPLDGNQYNSNHALIGYREKGDRFIL